MDYKTDVGLSRLTKLLILFLTILATELGSNLGIYLAIGIWLYLDLVIATERRIIDRFTRK